MDKRIRVLGVLLLVCFGLLFLQLNNWQVRQSSSLQNSTFEPAPPNSFTLPRGDIVTSDGQVLAESVSTNDEYSELRQYPQGSLTADITGYYDVTQQADSGLEAEYNDYLAQHQGQSSNLSQLITAHNGTDDVVTTINLKLQKIAKAALDAHGPEGAVMAINPQTGAILAMYSNPTFDPNILAAHNADAVAKAYNKLDPSSGDSPLVNGVTQRTEFPGSTMKVITTSAMFDHDPALTQMVWPVIAQTKLPDTPLQLHNFGGEKCGGDLQAILAKSCDTAYALAGVALGAVSLADEASAFGFNKVPPIDLEQFGATQATAAQFPSLKALAQNPPYVGYSAIGQFDVQETVLQNALVASAIANSGVIMTPHLMSRIVNDEGVTLETYKPHAWLKATSGATADSVRELMLGVSTSGTASGLFPASDDVASKTGTAETGGPTECSANWLIATAPAGLADTPKIAVAAEVPYQAGNGCNETGALVAGPIVKAVLVAALNAGL